MRDALHKHRLFLAVMTAILFLSFAFDAFGAMNSLSFVSDYKDSEALVVSEIACHGLDGGFLLTDKSGDPAHEVFHCTPKQLTYYGSQFGLQGRIYSLGYDLLSPAHVSIGIYVKLAQLLTALLSAFCFALVALWARSRHGLVPAVTFTLLIAISPMPVGFARNLYWALPLLVAPIIFVLWGYRRQASAARRAIFWSIVGLLTCAKFLCGYEYVTSLAVMVVAGVAYHLYLERAKRQIYFKELALAFAVVVLSFFVAMGIHVIALTPVAGSFGKAVEVVKLDALKRTVNTGGYASYAITGLQTNLPDFYLITNAYAGLSGHVHSHNIVWAAMSAGLNYIFMPIINLPVVLDQPFATYVQSFAAIAVVLVLLFVNRAKWVIASQQRAVEALFVGAGVGMLAYLSWLIFAPSHSLVHAFLNGILLFMPFALFAYIILGLYLDYLLQKFKTPRFRKA